MSEHIREPAEHACLKLIKECDLGLLVYGFFKQEIKLNFVFLAKQSAVSRLARLDQDPSWSAFRVHWRSKLGYILFTNLREALFQVTLDSVYELEVSFSRNIIFVDLANLQLESIHGVYGLDPLCLQQFLASGSCTGLLKLDEVEVIAYHNRLVLEGQFVIDWQQTIKEKGFEIPQVDQQFLLEQRRKLSIFDLKNEAISHCDDLPPPFLCDEPQVLELRLLQFSKPADKKSSLPEPSEIISLNLLTKFDLLRLAHISVLLTLNSEVDQAFDSAAMVLRVVVVKILCQGFQLLLNGLNLSQ
jgi:hypothetical protein